jgi:hypothetical protein
MKHLAKTPLTGNGSRRRILTAPKLNGHGLLRGVLEAAVTESELSRADLTVLSANVDPYRLDTPAGHRDGAWAAEQLRQVFGATRSTHLRGLHYAIVVLGNIRKPDGNIFRNTDDDWLWLSEVAIKAARWLGLIEFSQIVDNRNSEPIIHKKKKVAPECFVSIGINVNIPNVADLEPSPGANGFVPSTRNHSWVIRRFLNRRW